MFLYSILILPGTGVKDEALKETFWLDSDSDTNRNSSITFVCSNGEVIPAVLVCDADENCRDGTDETKCTIGQYI